MSVADQMTLGENEKKVLSALATGKFTLRTRSGISSETHLPKDQVVKILAALATQGLARSARVLVRGEPKTRWFATEDGRAVVQ